MVRSNLAPNFVSQRRGLLERYLQRLVTMELSADLSLPLLDFLGVAEHDVIAVVLFLLSWFSSNYYLGMNSLCWCDSIVLI